MATDSVIPRKFKTPKHPGWKKIRQAERHKRAQEVHSYNKRSPVEQLAELDKRLGKNIGARMERTKLNSIINSTTTPKE